MVLINLTSGVELKPCVLYVMEAALFVAVKNTPMINK